MIGKVMGMGVNLPTARRCDFCKRPVKFGYLVKGDMPANGFFCGRQHYHAAAKHYQELKEKHGDKANQSEG